MIKTKNNTSRDAISDDGVDVFGVLLPFRLFLVKLNGIVDFLEQLMNSNSTIFYILQFIGNGCLEDVVVFLWRNRLVFAVDHRTF